MGLSSQQVSSSGVDWSQTLLQAQTLELPIPPSLKRPQNQNDQNQQSEPVKCPRCDSTNTKFCYYNNYNRLQPRHFCKNCKRHWTKGGTLRNVPVGGGRKNKRPKTSNTTTAPSNSTSTSTVSTITSAATIRNSNNNQPIYRALVSPSSSMLQQNLINSRNLGLDRKGTFNNNNDVFVGSPFSLPQNQSLQIPFSSSSGFDTNPPSGSSSFQFSNVYNHAGEDLTITSFLPTMSSSTFTQPWQGPVTSGGMDTTTTSGYWNWEDIDTLVSTTDLNTTWNDSEIKP